MAYGTVKVDNITFDNGGSDQNVTVSGLYRATTSGVTVSGTIVAATVSGVTVIGSTTVSGATVTGTTANFTSGNFSNIISSAATMSGALIMANQQQVRFREAVGNGVNYIALQAPAIVSADQTITLPDQTGTVVTTGDNGSVSSTMLATNLTISAAAGSAAAPSIAFTGDLNTGIYSPGADQLAVSTGGTGRLFVDASGRLLVGASSWSDRATSVLQGNSTDGATGPGYLVLSRGLAPGSLSAGNTIGLVAFTANNAGSFGQIVCEADGAVGTGDYPGRLMFSTTADGAASPTERVRIDSSGRVGIGTSSPSSTLEIRSAPDTVGKTNGIVSDVSSPGLTAAQINSTTIGIGVNGLAVNFAGDYHIRSFWGFSIDKGAGNLSSGASNSVNADSRTFAVRQYAGGTTWNTQFCVTGGGYVKASNTGTYTDSGGGSRATSLQHFFRNDQNGLTVLATNTNTSSAVEGFTSDFATGATGNHFIGSVNLGRVFIVAANGNVANANNSYGAISDIKLKENIVDANSQWNDLKALQIRNYNFKNGQTHTQIGLIAQEAELVSPGLISESPDLDAEGNELGTVTKSVKYSVLYMKAVKALQEAIVRIETLETAVAALQGA
jgi:hypothetical protein